MQSIGMPTVACIRLGFLGFFVFSFSHMASSQDSTGRPPLPTAEEIAALAPDGGPEFNRLIFEKSPYLLQHAANPVDWWPWSEEAFAEAAETGRPIFLSIGYATCHWCHVMEHESFEDSEIAKLINEHYIPIKVDREERPDIDEVYMRVTEAMTGGGGWPMTVFLTPEKEPFFAGTYFPKNSTSGRPGLRDLLTEIAKAWEERRGEIETSARGIVSQLGQMLSASPGGDLDESVLEQARQQMGRRFDPERGGFSVRPKFPIPANLRFLLRHYHRSQDTESLAMVEKTLTEIRRGGIWDHVGYGIHRYSTDRDWLVPHFEKMLYDQSAYVLACLEAYQVTGKEDYARSARETLRYVSRDLTSPEGGFYSAEDADSEGEEGKFYTWSYDEVIAVLGEGEGRWFCEQYQILPEGNFAEEATQKRTQVNIPHLRTDLSEEDRIRVAPLREKLWQHRERRIHPLKDDKILTDWNGLMISAYAAAARILGDEEYSTAATRAAEFLFTHLDKGEGRLWKRHREGESGLSAHLEDYAFVITAMLDLYETNFSTRYLERAITYQASLDRFFWDEKEGGYFTIAEDSETLIVRAKKLYGGATPSGNAISLSNLSRLYRMTGDPHYAERCDALLRAFSGEIAQQPFAYPAALCGLDFLLGPTREIVICGGGEAADTRAMVAALRKGFRPRQTVLLRSPDSARALAKLAPFTASQKSKDDKATAYVCQDFSCRAPTTDIGEMLKNLGGE